MGKENELLYLGTMLGFPLHVEVPKGMSDEEIQVLHDTFTEFVMRSKFTEIDPVLAKLAGIKTKTIMID